MLVKSIHFLSQSIFVSCSRLQENGVRILRYQIGLKLVFWLESIDAKELGISDFFIGIGDIEFIAVFASNEICFNLILALNHIQQKGLIQRQRFFKIPFLFWNVSQRAIEVDHGRIEL